MNQLQALPLFRKISPKDIAAMMDCFCAAVLCMEKGEVLSGRRNEVVCVLEGEADGLQTGVLSPMPAMLAAQSPALLLRMEAHMLLYPCYGCCFYHAQLLQNMREMGIDLQSLEGQRHT